MTVWYVIIGAVGFAVTAALTPVARWIANRRGIVDDPASDPKRKLHQRPTALLGGLAIIVGTILTWWLAWWSGVLPDHHLPLKYLIGLTIAGVIIAAIGLADDRWRLPPARQFWLTLLPIAVIIVVGIGVVSITNPFGGLWQLDQWQIPVWRWHNWNYHITIWADVFTVLWVLGTMYTTKILDGVDGLVSGLGVIGSIVVFLLTLRPEVNQPAVALLALALGGACAGFLIFNWHPASIFLGESGSLFIGFMLGVLAIISGSKIATALLILGLPIMDLAGVMVTRRFLRGKNPFRTADRSHLHFRLQDAGLSPRQTVLLIWGITAVFGLATLLVTRAMKVGVLVGLVIVVLGLMNWTSRHTKRILP